ncbi:MAG: hypothetical protein M3N29_07600 [Chloroflexota bacterium]|nr:hypothetical protein [Chloroflexota bacterium]
MLQHVSPARVSDLEAVAARTGMAEMLVRAELHAAQLGRPGALESALVFGARIDNADVLARLPTPLPASRLGAG